MMQADTQPVRPSLFLRIAGAGFAVIAGAPWAVLLWLFLFVVPKFREIFERFEIKSGLPAATQAIISISAVLTTFWPVAVLMVVGGTALLAVLCCRARTSRVIIAAAVACAVSLLLFAVCLPILTVSLFQPLVPLIKTANGPQ
jgi:hypothetical protein